MITGFITIEVPQQPSIALLHRSILQALQVQGTPLRWAITAIDVTQGTVQVEAVVTRE